MSKILVFNFILILVSALTSFFVYEYVTYSQINGLLDSLQELSAAVFALAGIWVAYIYPEAIAAFTNPKDISLLQGTEKTKRVEELVLIILNSAFVLLVTMFIFLFETLFKNLPIIQLNKEFIRFILVSLSIFLTVVQSRSMLYVMKNNINFVNELYDYKRKTKADNDL
jgi:hypothetical protein